MLVPILVIVIGIMYWWQSNENKSKPLGNGWMVWHRDMLPDGIQVHIAGVNEAEGTMEFRFIGGPETLVGGRNDVSIPRYIANSIKKTCVVHPVAVVSVTDNATIKTAVEVAIELDSRQANVCVLVIPYRGISELIELKEGSLVPLPTSWYLYGENGEFKDRIEVNTSEDVIEWTLSLAR